MCCSSGVCGPKPDQAVCIFCRSEPVY
ncbi:hypothetical protein [Salinisphaera sp. G21_0]